MNNQGVQGVVASSEHYFNVGSSSSICIQHKMIHVPAPRVPTPLREKASFCARHKKAKSHITLSEESRVLPLTLNQGLRIQHKYLVSNFPHQITKQHAHTAVVCKHSGNSEMALKCL